MSDLTNDEMAAIVREWTPQSLALFYNWLHAGSSVTFPDHMWPVACALCDRRINNLMLQIGPGAGKSLMLSVVYPTWLIGHDPSTTIIAISGAEDLAGGFVGAAMQFVEHSEAFKLSFPGVKPNKDLGWSSGGMFVTGHRMGDPDATYNAFGMTSKQMTGKHAKNLIFDDLHTKANSETSAACAKVVGSYTADLIGRQDPTGARFVLAGRRWNVDDLYGKLQHSEEWVVLTLPAERPNSKTLYFDIMVPDDLECVFTDGFCETFDGDFVQVTSKVPKFEQVALNRRYLGSH